LTRSVAFLSRLLEAGVDVRFADLPQIEGATGRFLLQQMVAVAELEAGMISTRTKAALAAAKARGRVLGGARVRKSNGQRVVIGRQAQKMGAAANHQRAVSRAADLAPTIAAIRDGGAVTLRAIAAGLEAAGIATPRGQGKWNPTQVKRALRLSGSTLPRS
jgi:DNA invertase Pin-like site-specific DNA recombinase